MARPTETAIIPSVRNVYSADYAALPTSNVSLGDLGYAEDRKVLYRWDGAAWQPLTVHSSSGVAADIPAAADLPEGSLYFETDSKLLKQVQSGAWATLSTTAGIANLVLKGADESVFNSTVLQDDNALTRAIQANETWLYLFFIAYTSAAAAGIKFTVTAPAGATVYNGPPKYFDTTNAGLGINGPTTVAGGANPGGQLIMAIVRNGGTAGNTTLRWAQNMADASNTTVLTGSCVVAYKLA